MTNTSSIDEKIKSDEDREFLFRKLVSVLISSKKVFYSILPEIMTQTEKASKKLDHSNLITQYPALYENIANIISGRY